MGSWLRVLPWGVALGLAGACAAKWGEEGPRQADTHARLEAPAPLRTDEPSTARTPAPSPSPGDRPTPGFQAGKGPIDESLHVALGIPKDGDESDDVLLDRSEYVVSYNPKLNVPNWVAWHLDARDLGRTKRTGKFSSDAALPSGFYVVQDSDYSGSGYDRGHMCPSADRTTSKDVNRTTFVFTNIVPQRHELNAGPWEKLEQHARELAQNGKELFIVAGSVFPPNARRIGKNPDPARQVAVPSANFKVVVVLERHGQGAGDVTASTPVLAVMMPNDRSTRDRDYTEYLTTVREIEATTKYDFLSRVPKSIQDIVEARTP